MIKLLNIIGYAILISMFCVALFVFVIAMSFDGTLLIDVNQYNEGIIEIIIIIIGLIFALYLTVKYFKGEIR
jgi:fumarate reductase subunit C